MRKTRYEEIANSIREKIFSGEYPINQYLPTQTELMKHFNTTSVTLQRALSLLSAEGLIIGRKGQGTRVIGSQDDSRLIPGNHYLGFTKQMRKSHLDFTIHLISFTVMMSDEAMNQRFGIEASEPIFVIKRVRNLHKQPYVFETSYIPVSKAPGLSAEAAEVSIYEYLKNELNLVVGKTFKTLSADIAAPEDMNLLHCSEHDAIFQIEEVNYAQGSNAPFEYSVSRNTYQTRNYSVIENPNS